MRKKLEKETYNIENAVEKNHWWFVGRRYLLKKVINENSDSQILEIGCGSGSNLRLLKESGFKNVIGVDLNQNAITFCKNKGFTNVKKMDASNLEFQDNSIDFIIIMDLLEHVENELYVLKEIKRVLKPNGKVFITVPAFRCLWGVQDMIGQHKRRYRKNQLMILLKENNFRVLKSNYFNFFLFFPIFFIRKIILLFNLRIKNENSINTKLINWILTKIFILDIYISLKLSFPFGVSIFFMVQSEET